MEIGRCLKYELHLLQGTSEQHGLSGLVQSNASYKLPLQSYLRSTIQVPVEILTQLGFRENDPNTIRDEKQFHQGPEICVLKL